MNKQLEAAIKAINFIEENIKQELDLEEVASGVDISKYHFHRIFKSITGKSVISYIRGRKLSMSLNELINTDFKIIDVSNEYHFKYEQTYIRSFREMFHITPAQYRKKQCELPIEQKIDVNCFSSVGEGMIVEPRMCIKPKFIIQGIQSFIAHEKNTKDRDTNKQAELFEKVYYPQIENAIKDVYIGYVIYKDYYYGNDYVSGVEVTQKNEVKPPIVTHEIPTYEYAVFRYIGLHSPYELDYVTIKELYHYTDVWRSNTAYKQAAPFHFERMDMKVCSDNYCEMDIYVPMILQ